jgi:hypothetical protein
MRPLAFEPVDRPLTGHGVHPGVEAIGGLGTGRLEGVEVAVLADQVVGAGQDISLGQLHARLGTALGFGVRRDTGVQRHTVVMRHRKHGAVAHRQAGHVRCAHRALVVGEPVGGRTAQDALGAVEGRDDRGHGAIGQREDHPKAAPGQPGTEQHRRHPVDHGSLAVVELEPQARLGDPGLIDAVGATAVFVFEHGHDPAGGAF